MRSPSGYRSKGEGRTTRLAPSDAAYGSIAGKKQARADVLTDPPIYVPIHLVANVIDWPARAALVADLARQHAAMHDTDDSFVSEGYAALREGEFFTALVPAELGGGGAKISEMCDAIRIIAAACGSTALAFSMHSHVVAVAAWRWKHQRAPTDALIRRVAAEGLILASSGGSDWLQSGGTAVKAEGGFEITARKAFSSGSPEADLLATSAVYEDPEAGPTVLHFSVPLKNERVKHLPTWQVMGMRGTGSNDIEIDRLFVPDSAILGRRPKGPWHMLFHVISKIAFALIYSAYLGVADGARAKAVAVAAKRPPDDVLATLAGEMDNGLTAADLAWRRMIEIAETADPGPETTAAAMACRTLVAKGAITAVEKAMEVAGGGGFYRKMGMERIFRDIQAARFHPLQEKAQLDFGGRVALGWDING